MKTQRTTRPAKAPMYYLHRSAATWESAMHRTARRPPADEGAARRERT
jgi:hypothetical protein